MITPLIKKFEWFVHLSDEDRRLLRAMASGGVQHALPGEDIVREGDHPVFVYLVLDGWAHRYKVLEDGRRQIISFFLPGDLCDLNIFLLKEMDHSIGALTSLSYLRVTRQVMDTLVEFSPRIRSALWWDTLVSAAIQREWTVNLGQRSAIERVSHLICELFIRTRMVGLGDDQTFPFPVIQADLAEATGMTTVHVNRVLQELRSRNLILFRRKRLRILDIEGLTRLALFNDNYLHLGREGAHMDADDRPAIGMG